MRQQTSYGAPASGPETEARVKWFNPEKGFGFVEMTDGSGEAFLHVRQVEAAGYSALESGTTLVIKVGAGQKGPQVQEIVSVDDARHRVCWAILDPPFRHYSAAASVEPESDGCRFVWTADVLPDELAGRVGEMMDTGLDVIRKTLESTSAN